MLLLFILMAVGYVANKVHVLNDEANKVLSKLVINVTMVATILDSVVGNQIENKSEVIIVFFLAALPFVLFPFISKILIKIMGKAILKKNELETMLVFPNIGFMGIPVISGIYGEEAVFYLSIFMLMFNISFFSYGIATLGKSTRSGKIKIKDMINPGVISAFIAIIIFVFEIQLPVVLVETLDMLGGVTTPLAMIVIGSTIANISVKEVFTEKLIYVYTILRLIIYPFIVWLLIKNFINNEMLLGITVIVSGMPTAANVVMACNEYGGDGEYVSKGIFLSTLGSMFTIPLLVYLLG